MLAAVSNTDCRFSEGTGIRAVQRNTTARELTRNQCVICGERRLPVYFQWRRFMSLGTILLIILILLLIGALPTWPYSGGWGYYPSGGLGLVVIIILILLLLGRL
jgi:hypothetical protein